MNRRNDSGLRIEKARPEDRSSWAGILRQALLSLLLFFAAGSAFCYAFLPEGLGSPLWGALLGALVCLAAAMLQCAQWKRYVTAGFFALLLLAAAIFSRRMADGLCLCWNAWCLQRTAVTGELRLGLAVTADASAQSGCVTLFLLLGGAVLAALCSAAVRRLRTVAAVLCIAAAGALIVLLQPERCPWQVLFLLAASALLLAYPGQMTGGAALTLGAGPVLVCAALAFAILMQVPDVRSGSLFQTLRDDTAQRLHAARYESQPQPLPEGDFTALSAKKTTEETMLYVQMDREEPMYLRGFVGQTYTGTGWEAVSGQALAGQAELLYWLHAGGFYPQTQTGTAAELLNTDGVETNRIDLQYAAACRRYLYAPYSAAAGSFPDTLRLLSLEEAALLSKTGDTDYLTYQTVYAAPEQTSQWVEQLQSPQTPEQERYLTQESGYRALTGQWDLTLSDEEKQTLAPYLDELAASCDGAELTPMQAVRCTQAFLETALTYDENTPALPQGEDFLRGTLQAGKGYDFHYATLAVLALRYYGVPARYAEGYVVTQSKAAEAVSGRAELTDADAHAWAEVYQPGVGWLPLELTPGYADSMGSAPQAGELGVGLSEREDAQSAVGTTAGEGKGAYLSEGTSYEPEAEQTADENNNDPDVPEQSHEERTRVVLRHVLFGMLLVLLLLAAACAALALRRRRVLKQRQAQFDAEDLHAALAWRFAYSLRLLGQLGLSCTGSTLALTDAVKEQLGEAYAADYRQMAGLNQEALFSTHDLTPAQRDSMTAFSQQTAELLKTKSAFFRRLRQRWILCLY